MLLRGDGLPFVFDSFFKQGERRRDEMPLRDWMVHFVE
jgi:hypothetical protein